MTVDIRLSGDPDEIGRLLVLLEHIGVELALNPKHYQNRGSFG